MVTAARHVVVVDRLRGSDLDRVARLLGVAPMPNEPDPNLLYRVQQRILAEHLIRNRQGGRHHV